MIEHLASYFKDFGVDATVGGAAVRGIFDNEYAEPLNFSGSSPTLLLASSAVPSVAQGDMVVTGGISYTIAGVEPDGTGMMRLRLVKV